MDPHRAINASIITLALFVFALSVKQAWQAYTEYTISNEVANVNRIADDLVAATGIEALERGMTANALGSQLATYPVLQKIGETRRKGDEKWNRASDIARTLAAKFPHEADFHLAMNEAEDARKALQQMRMYADACLRGEKCEATASEWIAAITRFITCNARLREAAYLTIDTQRHVTQLNLSLKRWVWMASEHAGRERATLAYHISARKPVPAALLDELKANRGVVDHSIMDIQSIKGLRNTDPRIKQAIAGMEENFLHRFSAVRAQAYAGAAHGNYSLSSDQWFEGATAAINSVLAVSAAVTEVTDGFAREDMRKATTHMAGHFALLGVTLMLVFVSLTKVRHATNALFQQKELAEVTLHSIGDAVITTDAQARVDYLNPVAEEMLGWTTREAHGRPLTEVFNIINGLTREPEPNPIEACLRENRVVGLASNTILIRRGGKEFAIEDSAAPIRNREGNVIGGVLVFYDTSQARHAAHLLSFHAAHDPLTGLINRREFERRLAELLLRAKNDGHQHVLCYMDLDQFKVINDTGGHMLGDKMLRQLAYLLRERVLDGSENLARMGGDEFGLLLENCSTEQAMRIADDIRQVVKDFRFVSEGKTFEIGVSIGLVQIDAGSISVAELLSEADAACYAAKEKGRNRVQIYQPGDIDLARRHGEMQWVSRINQALKEGRFHLYCQAIAPIGQSRVPHCEVLLRMKDEQGHMVQPLAFIPAAERYGLMPAVDRWVIQSTLEAIGQNLRAQPGQPAKLHNINLSGTTFNDEGFEAFVREQLALHQVPAHAICFEMTETAAVANLEQAATLIKSLKADGCRFALDDFGSGLSSFMYLKSLPVDYLKIDGNFVKGMVDDPVAHAMVQSINTVGHVMGIKTIAEYVENDAILAKLDEMGVDYAQGWAIGMPRPIAECFVSDGCA